VLLEYNDMLTRTLEAQRVFFEGAAFARTGTAAGQCGTFR